MAKGVPKANQVHQENLALKAIKDWLALKDPRENPALKARKDSLDLKDLKENPALKARKDSLDLKDLKENPGEIQHPASRKAMALQRLQVMTTWQMP